MSSNPEKRRQRQASQNRRRLPTLAEVLARRTAPPVDLFCLYIYLQREDAEDALDFWLDVQQHENLCKAYFKDLRRAGRSVEEDWPEYAAYSREHGSIYTHITGDLVSSARPSAAGDAQDAGLSSPVSGAATGTATGTGTGTGTGAGTGRGAAGAGAGAGTWQAMSPTTPVSSLHAANRPAGPRFPGDPDYPLPGTAPSPGRSILGLPHKRSTLAPTTIPRDGAITQTDLIASAERIYARYLLPGSEKEIYLPSPLQIHSFPISASTRAEEQGEESRRALARIPDMFHAQKEYVFRTMEADVFNYFLRAKAFGNLTPASSLIRLVAGLLALWAALAAGFSFIFLDVGRQERCWVILPFTIAVLCLISHQYELDPLLHLLFNRSETTPFKYIPVREKYIRGLLTRRSLGVLLITVSITAALCVLFIFVPGKRL